MSIHCETSGLQSVPENETLRILVGTSRNPLGTMDSKGLEWSNDKLDKWAYAF